MFRHLFIIVFAFLLFSEAKDANIVKRKLISPTPQELLDERRTLPPGFIPTPRHPDWCGTDRHSHDPSNTANSCAGTTVCDNEETVRFYMDSISSNQIEFQTLHYHVHSLCDPTDPTTCQVQDQWNSDQLGVFIEGYSPAKITFTAEYITHAHKFFNSRSLDCPDEWLGDDYADPGCASVGMDGGDFVCPPDYQCTIGECTFDDVLTGVAGCDCFCINHTVCAQEPSDPSAACRPDCNIAMYSWDYGHCCYEGADKCWDPTSPHRSWFNADALKALANDIPNDHFNVYLAPMDDSSNLLGYATFPWDENSQGIHGGMFFNLNNNAWGVWSGTGLLGLTAHHEFGHCLGLWHPFHGVTEIPGESKQEVCNNGCFEKAASWLTGDRIQDTPPTPINFACADPATCTEDPSNP